MPWGCQMVWTHYRCILFISLVLLVNLVLMPDFSGGRDKKMEAGDIKLPEPAQKGSMSLEEALARRESVRNFSSMPLTLTEISQLMWAGQGITRPWGGRTAPSAGALYPLELYIALPEGFFHYIPGGHRLVRCIERNIIADLARAALGQECVRNASAVIVIAAVYERIEGKYGSRGERYVKVEAGHAAQNILLEAVSLGLGAVPVGAFYDEEVKKVLEFPLDHAPLYLIPVGHPE